MVVAWRYENSPDYWVNWERYFDAQIKQKILPKLHGSQKAIGNVLDNLFRFAFLFINYSSLFSRITSLQISNTSFDKPTVFANFSKVGSGLGFSTVLTFSPFLSVVISHLSDV